MKQYSTPRLVAMLTTLVVGMFGFGFALVPLYDVFCEVTGIRLADSGRVSIAEFEKSTNPAAERWVTVTFDTAVDRGLAWTFDANEKKMRVRVGELNEAFFTATNEAAVTVIGHAVPSVSPTGASLYFAKTECFCFTQQQLIAGESRQMPVRFVIDPELPNEITVLTLSYRFYNTVQATVQLKPGGIDTTETI
jgi:cytochrome c oxidase assembly protein subunit 11